MKTYIEELKIGERSEVSGFIDTVREQKTMLFVILRDRSGKLQVAIDKQKHKEIYEAVSPLLTDSVVRFIGTAIAAPQVKPRGLEFVPESVIIESTAKNSPIDKSSSVELKQAYRWIDLRDEKIG